MDHESFVKEIVREGIIFGHKRSKTHPKMKPYISGTKNEIELLNPESCIETLEKAAKFLKEKKAAGAVFLLVGTKPAAKSAIQEFAAAFSFPYVTARWLGGTITNYGMIGKRIAYYEDLKDKQARGGFDKYTKKEQRGFVEQIGKMRENFEGLRPLKKVPDVLVFVDGNESEIAIREAKRMNIPVVGIIDTNDDPSGIDFPILANDHSVKSVTWVFQYLRDAIQ